MLARSYILLLFIFLNTLLAKAKPILLLNSNSKSEFGKYLYSFLDSSNSLQINDVIKLKDQFVPVKEKVFSHLPSIQTYWIKFNINNTSGKDFYLLIDNPSIKELDIYIFQDNKEIRLRKTGINHSFYSREILKNTFVYRLDITSNKEAVVYIRYISIRGELPLVIATAPELMDIFQTNDLLWGIFFGIFIAVILYNLFIFLGLKDKSYFFLILFYIFHGLYVSTLFGYSFQYFFPNYPNLNHFIYTFSALASVFGVLFSIHFLSLKANSSLLYKLSLIFIFLFLMQAIININNELFASFMDSILKIAIGPFLILTGIIIYAKGYKYARYYLIATVSIMVAVLLNNFRILGYIPTNEITIKLAYWGLALNGILFSIAMGDRYNNYRKEKELVQKESNRELDKLNQNLVQTNSDLDNFVYTASHDLKGPISNIEGIMNLLQDDKMEKKERKEFYKMIQDSIYKFKDTSQSLIEVSSVQRLRDEKKDDINIQKSIEEVLILFKEDINTLNINIKNNITEPTRLLFSQKHFNRILEILISNAIKFRSPERTPEIIFNSEETENYYILSIKDNGLGIKKDYLKKVFSIFTKAHQINNGKGIGLYILKRILENEGGLIELESTENQGSKFILHFKK